MDASIRTFDETDFAFAVAQTNREGWDATAELFEACLAHDSDGCFIAEAEGRPVGMATATRYDLTGWVGNLVVLPEYRRQGLGRRLMNRAMAYLSDRGARTIRLEADPLGIKLYRRLGFVDEFESLRFRRLPTRSCKEAEVEHIMPADLPAVTAFDAEHFGDQRGRLLALLLQRSRATYRLCEGRAVRAYALVLPSRFGVRLGPFVADTADVAKRLLRAIIGDWPDTTIAVGVPAPNGDAVSLFQSCGFERTPSSFRMVHGVQAGAGHPDRVFAIANGALG